MAQSHPRRGCKERVSRMMARLQRNTCGRLAAICNSYVMRSLSKCSIVRSRSVRYPVFQELAEIGLQELHHHVARRGRDLAQHGLHRDAVAAHAIHFAELEV